MSSNSVGILGGTFNPIHNQHLHLAECAFRQLSLSKVMLMPSGISYLKAGTDVLPADKRLEMCYLAAEDIPYLEVSDIEIKRSGNTYTCDTLKELIAAAPGNTYYLIIGADTFFMLDKWRDPEYIFGNCIIAVASRPDGDADVSERLRLKIREYEGRFNAAVRLIDIDVSPLSSSMIRELINKNGNADRYLPKKVADYIKMNGLYR